MNLACVKTEPNTYAIVIHYPGHTLTLATIRHCRHSDPAMRWRCHSLWSDLPHGPVGHRTKAQAIAHSMNHLLRAARLYDPLAKRFPGEELTAQIGRLTDDEITARAVGILAARHAPGQPLCSPTDTARYLTLKVADEPSEVFGAIWLDNRHRVLADDHLFTGTIDGASVYPRTVVRRAMEHNAAACICYHNHPSGDPTPSQADRALTRRLTEALALVDVRLLDHVVVGYSGTLSFAEKGML